MNGKSGILKSDGMRARAFRSTFFSVVGFGGQNALRLGSNLILTRILFPEAFGLMALVQVVLTGLAMFSDLGIRASVIQDERGTDPKFLNTAWTLQVGRGFVLWLATVVLAGPVAAFYEEPILAQLLPVAGLTALFQGFNSTRMATVNRDLALGRLTMLSLGCQAFGVAIMIYLAWLWGSVWGLVWGGIAAAALLAALSHVVLPGSPNRLFWDISAARKLIGFGKYIFLSTIAGFLILQADRAILGKFISLADLSRYSIAFFLASAPLLLVRQINDKVMFPLYRSRPPAESLHNRTQIARARMGMTGLAMCITAVFALFGDDLIGLLYDARYQGAGPLLVLLASASLFLLITPAYGALVLSTGKSGRYAVIVVGIALLKTGFMLYGVQSYGVVGVIAAAALAEILFYPVLIMLVFPYKGWFPLQDLAYFVLALLILWAALWANPSATALIMDAVNTHASQ